MVLAEVLTVVLAAVVYSLSGIFKSLPKGELIDYTKVLATVIVGLGVGTVMYLTGTVPTEDNVLLVLATYAGATVTVENILKGIKRYIEKA